MNARGEYGSRRFAGRAPYVGSAGSLFGHTPGDTEDELDQLHGEIMNFGQEVLGQVRRVDDPETRHLRDEEIAAWKVVDSFQPLVSQVERVKSEMAASASTAALASLVPELGKAQAALDRFMPAEQRHAAIARARSLSDQRAAHEDQKLADQPIVVWSRSTWEPFLDSWKKFRGEKKDVALQLWPGSGTWDRVQEYRQQFVDLRAHAPFTAKGPAPLDPSERKDPSWTDALKELGGVFKYGLYGLLGVGAVMALSSVVTNVRKGEDPVGKYVEYARGRRG